MSRFVVRDALLLLIALLLWIPTWTIPALAVPTAIATGLAAFQLHEWGHWLGATKAGAVITPARSLSSPFLFNFDSKANSRRQFLAMSWPGFVATAGFLAAFHWWLPDSHPATPLTRQIGWGLAAVTIIIEIPLALWTLAGGRIPPVSVFLPGKR
jgi:hypothetical protein